MAKKSGFVRTANQAQDRRCDIDLAAKLGQTRGSFDHNRAKNKKRNFVGMNRDRLASIHSRAMVRYDHKNCAGPESLLLRGGEELPQRPVRIFHGVRTGGLARVFWNAAGPVSESGRAAGRG